MRTCCSLSAKAAARYTASSAPYSSHPQVPCGNRFRKVIIELEVVNHVFVLGQPLNPINPSHEFRVLVWRLRLNFFMGIRITEERVHDSQTPDEFCEADSRVMLGVVRGLPGEEAVVEATSSSGSR